MVWNYCTICSIVHMHSRTHALTYTIRTFTLHTCFGCISWASWVCIFIHCLLLKVVRLTETRANFCCNCKCYFLSSLMSAFCSTVWIKTSSCWRFSTAAPLRRGALGQTSVREGKEWVNQGWQKHFSNWSDKINIVQALYIYSEVAKLLIIHTRCW